MFLRRWKWIRWICNMLIFSLSVYILYIWHYTCIVYIIVCTSECIFIHSTIHFRAALNTIIHSIFNIFSSRITDKFFDRCNFLFLSLAVRFFLYLCRLTVLKNIIWSLRQIKYFCFGSLFRRSRCRAMSCDVYFASYAFLRVSRIYFSAVETCLIASFITLFKWIPFRERRFRPNM